MNELLRLCPRRDFQKASEFYNANSYTKYFSTWQQFIVLLYAQITGADSLREIETSLNMHSRKWYHLGLEGVKRSTLSDAMNRRSSEVFEEMFYGLLDRCRSFTPQKKFKFKNPLFAMDATVIGLCLSVFPWAKYRTRKGAIKLHYLYNQNSSVPSFITMSDGKTHDVRVAKSDNRLMFELMPDSIVAMDKAYVDFEFLYSLGKRGVFFVTRQKMNILYAVTGQHAPIKNKHILRDDNIVLTGKDTPEKYPDQLRLVGYLDPETGKYYEYLTNNGKLAASTIAGIYETRWKIEEFFKWIKTHLKIKSFLGTSYDAVMTQVWVAMCYYLLLKFIQFQARYKGTLTLLHRKISAVLLDRMSLIQVLRTTPENLLRNKEPDAQPLLF